MYAIKFGRHTVAHLSRGPFHGPLCGRSANMTSNAPGGKRVCRDCTKIAEAELAESSTTDRS